MSSARKSLQDLLNGVSPINKKPKKKSSKKKYGGKRKSGYIEAQSEVAKQLIKLIGHDAKQNISMIKLISYVRQKTADKSMSALESLKGVVPYVKNNLDQCIKKYNEFEKEPKTRKSKKSKN
jgi:hypothetical protein